MSSYPGNGGNGVEWPHEQLTAALQEQPRELPANANWRDAALALSNMFVQDHELKKATVQALYFLKVGHEGMQLDIKRMLEWQRNQELAHKGLDKKVAQTEVQLPTKIAKEVREQIAEAKEATKPDVPRPVLRIPGQKPTLLPEVRDRAPSYSQIADESMREEMQKLARQLIDERHKVELREAAIVARDDLLREQAQDAEKEKHEREAAEHARAEEKRQNEELELKKSGERRAWLAAKIAAATVVGGGIWQMLHAVGVIK